jgi:dCTP deaminase
MLLTPIINTIQQNELFKVIQSVTKIIAAHPRLISWIITITMLITTLRRLRNYCRKSRGAILSDGEIIAELGKNVVISPFNRDQLGPNSYDITLGQYYYEPQVDKLPQFLHPENAKQTIQYWGVTAEDADVINNKGQYGCKIAQKVKSEDEALLHGVNVDDQIIVIQPGHVILGHTNEFIGGRNNITTTLHSRSTMGRSCVSCCGDAGFGDCGYVNRYTLEIENHGLTPIVLNVGQRVGQIGFHRTGDVLISYERRGQYQGTNSLDKLIQSWNPLCMLPANVGKLIRSQ